jgi:hypothetical protein
MLLRDNKYREAGKRGVYDDADGSRERRTLYRSSQEQLRVVATSRCRCEEEESAKKSQRSASTGGRSSGGPKLPGPRYARRVPKLRGVRRVLFSLHTIIKNERLINGRIQYPRCSCHICALE